jgi:hypothetical protein
MPRAITVVAIVVGCKSIESPVRSGKADTSKEGASGMTGARATKIARGGGLVADASLRAMPGGFHLDPKVGCRSLATLQANNFFARP